MPDAAQGPALPRTIRRPPVIRTSGLDADIAVDEKFAASHALAGMIEAVAASFNANLLGIAHLQPKHLANINAATCRLQFDAFDLAGWFAGKQMRNERRQIEPLRGALAEGESQRSHGSNSRK